MKDIKIDGRTQRVFVLRENESRMVYIPVKSLNRVDYERLKDIEKKQTSDDLLTVMADTKLDNGLNALILYNNIIQVMDKTEGNKRIRKPDEKESKPEPNGEVKVVERIIERVVEVPPKEPVAERRKPGPKPGTKRKPAVQQPQEPVSQE